VLIAFLPEVLLAIIVVIAAAISAAVKGLIQNTFGGMSYAKALASLASIVILGVIAAFDQVARATTVTACILIAVLARPAGVVIVGLGGGVIQPMSSLGKRYLRSPEQQVPRIKTRPRLHRASASGPARSKDQLQNRVSPPAHGQRRR